MSKNTENNRSTNLFKIIWTFILSCISGLISKTLLSPIDRVKLLLQCQKVLLDKGVLDTSYKGVLDCISRIYNTEGFLSFWKGNLSDCIRHILTQALSQTLKDRITKAFSNNTDNFYIKYFKNLLSGALAGCIFLLPIYSLDVCSARLALDIISAKDGQRQYSGIIDVYYQIITTEGVIGFYRSYLLSCLGIFVYRGLYFTIYDALKPIAGNNKNRMNSFILALFVLVITGLICYPLDTVRTTIMITSCAEVQYLDFLKVCQNEDCGYLFSGAGVNVIKGIAGAIIIEGINDIHMLGQIIRLILY
jgi:solute carrier family 25 (adenine nucleotide translocator) protein 4/5/6/31